MSGKMHDFLYGKPKTPENLSENTILAKSIVDGNISISKTEYILIVDATQLFTYDNLIKAVNKMAQNGYEALNFSVSTSAQLLNYGYVLMRKKQNGV